MVLGSDVLAGKGYQLISDCDYVLVQCFYKSDPQAISIVPGEFVKN